MSKVGKVAQIIGPVDVVFNGKDVELQNLWFIRNHKKDGTLLVLEAISHWWKYGSVPFRWTQQMVWVEVMK
jgi:hypothetical protein